MIVNRKSDLVVSVDNGNTASGTAVVILPANGKSSQKWEFERVGEYLDKIESLNFGTRVLGNCSEEYGVSYTTRFIIMRRWSRAY